MIHFRSYRVRASMMRQSLARDFRISKCGGTGMYERDLNSPFHKDTSSIFVIINVKICTFSWLKKL